MGHRRYAVAQSISLHCVKGLIPSLPSSFCYHDLTPVLSSLSSLLLVLILRHFDLYATIERRLFAVPCDRSGHRKVLGRIPATESPPSEV